MMEDAHYAAMFNRLVAVCEERNVVVQTIKAIARRPWWGRDHTCATWGMSRSRSSVISTPRCIGSWPDAGVFLMTAGDIHLAAKVLDAADRFTTTRAMKRSGAHFPFGGDSTFRLAHRFASVSPSSQCLIVPHEIHRMANGCFRPWRDGTLRRRSTLGHF
mgnify:CR=1 FL=1